MTADTYILSHMPEIGRLERQAALQGVDRVVDHVDLAAGQRMLDAGSGSGWVSRLIAKQVPQAQVRGIDITPEFAGYANDRAQTEELSNLSYDTGTITDLPYANDEFDLVWSQYVVFFLREPSQALSEFARVVRPGGKVIVAVTECPFQMLTPERPALSEGIAKLRDRGLHGWRSWRLPQMMRAAGLTDIEVSIAVDRVHSFVGGASSAQRRNIEESYGSALRGMTDLVGGTKQAEKLLQDLQDFMSDSESSAFSTHWTVTGKGPA